MPKPISLEHLPRGTRILEHDTFSIGEPEKDQIRINRFSRLGGACVVYHGIVFTDPLGRKTRLSQAEDTALVLGMAGLNVQQTMDTLHKTEDTIKEARITAYAKLGVPHSKIAMAPATRRLVETGLVRFEFPIDPPFDLPDLHNRMQYIEGFSRGTPLGKMGDDPETTVKSRMRYVYERLENVIDPKLGNVHDQQSMVFYAIGCGLLQVDTPYGPAAPLIMPPTEGPYA